MRSTAQQLVHELQAAHNAAVEEAQEERQQREALLAHLQSIQVLCGVCWGVRFLCGRGMLLSVAAQHWCFFAGRLQLPVPEPVPLPPLVILLL